MDDGAETDLDLGHYERFCDLRLTHNSTVTTGQVYQEVLDRERRGDYLGGTIQVIPHITNEIKRRIALVGKASNADIALVEVGGTVGDIEGSAVSGSHPGNGATTWGAAIRLRAPDLASLPESHRRN